MTTPKDTTPKDDTATTVAGPVEAPAAVPNKRYAVGSAPGDIAKRTTYQDRFGKVSKDNPVGGGRVIVQEGEEISQAAADRLAQK